MKSVGFHIVIIKSNNNKMNKSGDKTTMIMMSESTQNVVIKCNKM